MNYSKLLSLLAVFVLFVNDTVDAEADVAALKKFNIPASRNGSTPSRHLSVWGSIIHFIACPPGPLGNRQSCKNYNRNGNNGGGGGNNGGGNNGGNENGGAGNENKRSWENWFSGGSGAFYGGDGGNQQQNKDGNGAGAIRVGSFPWFLMAFGLIGLVGGGGYMAYKTVREKEENAVSTEQGNVQPTYQSPDDDVEIDQQSDVASEPEGKEASLLQQAVSEEVEGEGGATSRRTFRQKVKDFFNRRKGGPSSTSDEYRLSQQDGAVLA